MHAQAQVSKGVQAMPCIPGGSSRSCSERPCGCYEAAGNPRRGSLVPKEEEMKGPASCCTLPSNLSPVITDLILIWHKSEEKPLTTKHNKASTTGMSCTIARIIEQPHLDTLPKVRKERGKTFTTSHRYTRVKKEELRIVGALFLCLSTPPKNGLYFLWDGIGKTKGKILTTQTAKHIQQAAINISSQKCSKQELS